MREDWGGLDRVKTPVMAKESVQIREISTFNLWLKVLALLTLFLIITFLSFLCVHLIVLMLHWMIEERRFYNFRQVNLAILEHYKRQFYLWYLTLRNWDCHEGEKIKVIMPNYLAC